MGYVLGLVLRTLLGENTVGLPVLLQLPGCTLQDGVYVQKAPVRTFSMLSTFLSILVFSWLSSLMFSCGLLPEKWDTFRVKRAVRTPPRDAAVTHLSREAGGEEQPVQGLALQPMLSPES